MSIEKALGKLRAAQMCHPNAVQALIDEAITAIQQAEAQQPAATEPVWFHKHWGDDDDIFYRPDDKIPPGSTPLYTRPSPSVPDDVVRVPMQVLKDASEALGNFVSDHGWGDADMQAMDNLDAYIARHEANRAAMLAAK